MQPKQNLKPEDRNNRDRRRQRMSGITLLEVLVTVAFLGIIFLIGMPRYICMVQKSRMASQISDMEKARDQIELYEAELGVFPPDLDTVFPDGNAPSHLTYCVDNEDADSGHGNQRCLFFDPDNPSGQNEHGGVPGLGYLLLTEEGIGGSCANVDFLWLGCCGMEPRVVVQDEDIKLGHPGRS